MALKSMLPQALVSRRGRTTLEETKAPYFGIYLRLVPGSFATQAQAIEDILGTDRCIHLFLTETILKLTDALVRELQTCAEAGLIQVTSAHERQLVSDIINVIRPAVPQNSTTASLDDLEILIAQEVRFVADYVKRQIFGEVRDYDGVFLTVEDLKRICRSTTTIYLLSPEKTVYFLLDEFENLLSFQKIVTNSILKASEAGYFSVKIATKKAALTTSETLERQEIEEPHDYSSVDFDYNLSDRQERRCYKDLITTICSRILSHEGFKVTNINELLEAPLECDGLNKEDVERGKKKQFAGFEELVTLSSGIIRLFLELAGLSYHFAVQEKVNVRLGQHIGRNHQTNAAYALSNYYLDTIRSNVATVGPQIQQLVIDLGDIFRAKLLKHNSEPEASRLAIHDPHRLEESASEDLRTMLTEAVVHSIFQNPAPRGGMRPKHATDIQPREYILNRVYSPSLSISPRPRWRTLIGTDDLLGLMDPSSRQSTKSRLMRMATTSRSRSLQPELPLRTDSS